MTFSVSSRRRHTILQGDWSSDVCSSDLIPDLHRGSFHTYVELGGKISYLDPMMVLPVMARVTSHLGLGATLSTTFHPPYLLRSEERRVGKECSLYLSPTQSKLDT